jgi:hypothetical protein
MSIEACVQLEHQFMTPFCSKLPGSLMDLLHDCSLDVIVIQHKSTALQQFLRESDMQASFIYLIDLLV